MRNRIAGLVAVVVLLVALVVVLRWKASSVDPGDLPARVQPARSASRPADSARAVPDSDRAAALAMWGVLWPADGDQATFYEATVEDSSLTPEQLGFIRAASLSDATLAIELHAGDSASAAAHLLAPLPPDSIVRALRSDGCVDGPVVHLRRDGDPQHLWQVGLASGAATRVPLNAVEDSARMDAEAQHLSASIPADTAPRLEGVAPAGTLFRNAPYAVPLVYSFVDGGTEILVGVTRREAMSHPVGRDSIPMLEHTMVIGERPAGSHGRMTLVWQSRDVNDEDQLSVLSPGAVVRLGSEHRATIIVDVKGRDGGAGMFVQRIAPAKWREVAISSWGC